MRWDFVPGYGECREWVAPLEKCETGRRIPVSRGNFYQRVWENGAYPVVSIWGEETPAEYPLEEQSFSAVAGTCKVPRTGWRNLLFGL